MTRILFALLLSVFIAHAAVTPGGGGGGGGSYTTNVLSVTNVGLQYVSPPGGNNGVADARTNAPLFNGQIGVGVDAQSAGSGVYLYGGRSNTVGNWSSQFYFPAGIANIGSEFNTPTNSNHRHAAWYLNGNAKWSTRSNIVLSTGASVDSGWNFAQMNPYACALLWSPVTTINSQYAAGGYSAIGTNVLGEVIYWDEDIFGLTMGTISRHWPALETNQAGSYVLLLGGGGSTKPFHIADNHTEDGQLGQWSYLTIDRRGITNASSPWGIGFPMRNTNAWSETNANFRWGLYADYRDGSLKVTNGLTTLHSLYLNNTNNVNQYGKWAEAVAPHNFAGGASFNAHIFNASGYNAAWTFDAAEAHRLGFVIKSGNYPVLAYGAGTDFRIVQANVSDLQSGVSTQTHTNMLTITNNVLAVHTPTARFDGKVGIGTNAPDAALSISGNIRQAGAISNTAVYSTSVHENAGTKSRNVSVGYFSADTVDFAGAGGAVLWTDARFYRAGANTNAFGFNGTPSGSVIASNVITTGNIFQQFALVSPAAPPSQGALYWTDGTNVMATIRNSAGTITTNKLSMTAWP